MSSTISARIETITPTLQAVAAKFSPSTNQTADDLFQAMALHLLERAFADPEFANQTDAYLVQAGKLYVCNEEMRKARVQDKHFIEVDFDADANDEGDAWVDGLADYRELPETILIRKQGFQAMRLVADQLKDREKEIMALIIEGVASKDIAVMLGVSRAAVSQAKARIVAKFQTVL